MRGPLVQRGLDRSPRATAAGEFIEYDVNIGERDSKLRIEDSIEKIPRAVPVTGIWIGDIVRTSFHEQDGRLVAQGIEKVLCRQ